MDYGRHTHEHTHEDYNIAKLEIHLQNYHRNEDPVSLSHPHDHATKNPGKINAHYSDRIDVHPWALERLAKAELVFFGIEGCPKADAMLQNILDTGINASVVSVPAVGMWNAPELQNVCRFVLAGKTVVIVPDGDWAYNVMVENQARVFQSRLMEYGVQNVIIAAPPVVPVYDENGEPVFNPNGTRKVKAPKVEYKGKMEELKGVDDFLGLGKRSLADLACINYEPLPREEIEAWVREHLPPLPPERKRGYRSDHINSLVSKINALGLAGGEFQLTLGMLAGYLGIRHQHVSQALQELEDMGAITKHGDFNINKSFWGAWEWEGNKPKIVLLPELRGRKDDEIRLGDLLPHIWGE